MRCNQRVLAHATTTWAHRHSSWMAKRECNMCIRPRSTSSYIRTRHAANVIPKSFVMQLVSGLCQSSNAVAIKSFHMLHIYEGIPFCVVISSLYFSLLSLTREQLFVVVVRFSNFGQHCKDFFHTISRSIVCLARYMYRVDKPPTCTRHNIGHHQRVASSIAVFNSAWTRKKSSPHW